MIDVKIEPSWKELLQDEFDKPYFADLIQFARIPNHPRIPSRQAHL